MEAPHSCFCKGCQGQAGKTLQGICRNGNKDIPSCFCSHKQSFPCTLISKTSSTLRPGWKQQAKMTGFGKYLFLLQTKPLSVHSLCYCPSLAFRDLFGTNCSKHTFSNHLSCLIFPAHLPFCFWKHPFISLKHILNWRIFYFFQILIA